MSNCYFKPCKGNYGNNVVCQNIMTILNIEMMRDCDDDDDDAINHNKYLYPENVQKQC